MAKDAIPGMKAGGGVTSKVAGTAVVLAILAIVIKPGRRSMPRERDRRPRPSEVVIPITRNRPINLERSH